MPFETAQDIAAAIRRGETTAARVCRDTLDRIAALEPAIKAFTTIAADAATRQAEALDGRRDDWAALPLLGVPIALKDNLCTRGIRTTAASKILEHYVPPYDATVVERLALPARSSSARPTATSSRWARRPRTRRSWRRGTRGRSIARPADRAAARPRRWRRAWCRWRSGSDTGGSIRQPAALCGVVGLKPTYGRVSRFGLLAFASSLDQIGPIATTVADAALALEVIAGRDPRDATSSPATVAAYGEALTGDVRGLRIGVPRAPARGWRRRRDPRRVRGGAGDAD